MPHGTEEGLGPGHIVLDGDPVLPRRGTASNFRPMSIVAKRSPMSATAEHLHALLLLLLLLLPFYGHHTGGQSASAGIRRQELENFIAAKFYCPHSLADGN